MYELVYAVAETGNTHAETIGNFFLYIESVTMSALVLYGIGKVGKTIHEHFFRQGLEKKVSREKN